MEDDYRLQEVQPRDMQEDGKFFPLQVSQTTEGGKKKQPTTRETQGISSLAPTLDKSAEGGLVSVLPAYAGEPGLCPYLAEPVDSASHSEGKCKGNTQLTASFYTGICPIFFFLRDFKIWGQPSTFSRKDTGFSSFSQPCFKWGAQNLILAADESPAATGSHRESLPKGLRVKQVHGAWLSHRKAV